MNKDKVLARTLKSIVFQNSIDNVVDSTNEEPFTEVTNKNEKKRGKWLKDIFFIKIIEKHGKIFQIVSCDGQC